MTSHVGGGLPGLLARLLGKPGADQADAVGGGRLKVAADGTPKKGDPLAGEVVRHGVGYNLDDKGSANKNKAEKDALQRFLKDPELDKLREAISKVSEPETPGPERDQTSSQEAKEKRELQKEERKKEERADENRAFAKEQRQQLETPERRDREQERDKERERGGQDEDESEAKGQGYAAEEAAQDAEDAEHGQYDRDALGDNFRCRGTLEDGTRCLRKPLERTSYCREHTGGALNLPE